MWSQLTKLGISRAPHPLKPVQRPRRFQELPATAADQQQVTLAVEKKLKEAFKQPLALSCQAAEAARPVAAEDKKLCAAGNARLTCWVLH